MWKKGRAAPAVVLRGEDLSGLPFLLCAATALVMVGLLQIGSNLPGLSGCTYWGQQIASKISRHRRLDQPVTYTNSLSKARPGLVYVPAKRSEALQTDTRYGEHESLAAQAPISLTLHFPRFAAFGTVIGRSLSYLKFAMLGRPQYRWSYYDIYQDVFEPLLLRRPLRHQPPSLATSDHDPRSILPQQIQRFRYVIPRVKVLRDDIPTFIDGTSAPDVASRSPGLQRYNASICLDVAYHYLNEIQVGGDRTFNIFNHNQFGIIDGPVTICFETHHIFYSNGDPAVRRCFFERTARMLARQQPRAPASQLEPPVTLASNPSISMMMSNLTLGPVAGNALSHNSAISYYFMLFNNFTANEHSLLGVVLLL
ncbi:hypothetical protein C8J56DRAFT_888225 [Mycena floridula]|nr:hypothetical protein C8J56DRAFT_888225 [Mycena floridula]